jgi:hypothetical protein
MPCLPAVHIKSHFLKDMKTPFRAERGGEKARQLRRLGRFLHLTHILAGLGLRKRKGKHAWIFKMVKFTKAVCGLVSGWGAEEEDECERGG